MAPIVFASEPPPVRLKTRLRIKLSGLPANGQVVSIVNIRPRYGFHTFLFIESCFLPAPTLAFSFEFFGNLSNHRGVQWCTDVMRSRFPRVGCRAKCTHMPKHRVSARFTALIRFFQMAQARSLVAIGISFTCKLWEFRKSRILRLPNRYTHLSQPPPCILSARSRCLCFLRSCA